MARLHVARNTPRVSPIFLALVAVTIGGGALTLVPAEAAVTGGVVVLVLAGWAVSLCLHEFAHALVADRCGDHSVRAMGYLTLDIRRYANVGLTLVLPLLILLIGGIPLVGGAVWIQRGVLSRGAQSAVALSGPATNLVLAALFTIALAVIPGIPLFLGAGLSFFALLQVLAFVVNILPVPGLDGWGVIDPYLSYPTRATAARIAPYAPLGVLVIILLIPGVGQLLYYVADAIFTAVGGNGDASAIGQSLFFFWQR